MGTSKSYSASIKGQPQWGNLSRAVTRNCGKGNISPKSMDNIMSRYVDVIGGSGGAGRGGSKIASRAGIKTAQNIGGFFGAFHGSGGNLYNALDQIGLTGLRGKSLDEVINALLEYCSGPASTIDDVAAKTASQKIWEELASGAETTQEFQIKLNEILTEDALGEIMVKYFSYYIYEHLSIMFYEKMIVEKGKSDCNDLFRQIKDYIFERTKNINREKKLDRIDWRGAEADRLIKNIQEDVLKIFENYES